MRTRVALPYSHLAARYDAALGRSSFGRVRKAFDRLVRRYGIHFRSAADIGCGTGLFALYLRRRWRIPVMGVDRSPEMLTVASRNSRGAGVGLLLQDIRCLRLPRPVDLVTANFDTMNHVMTAPDLQQALRRIRANLRPGGYLLFDLLTHRQPWPTRATCTRKLTKGRGALQQRIRWDPFRRLLEILVIDRQPESTHEVIELHRERAYSPVDVARWLAAAGFRVLGVHDAATLRMASGCSPKVIFVARRAGAEGDRCDTGGLNRPTCDSAR